MDDEGFNELHYQDMARIDRFDGFADPDNFPDSCYDDDDPLAYDAALAESYDAEIEWQQAVDEMSDFDDIEF